MIDYIADIFTNLGASNSGSESVWQKYSTGVDSCAKIYGFCVDFIHSETYKVLGGLNRTGNQEVENENQDEDPTKPKKKKNLRRNRDFGKRYSKHYYHKIRKI